mgnify:CR=1 FL=1
MESLIGKKAPAFSADAVVNGGEFVENFSLEQYIGKNEVIFFFYPLDFTFVCPTELLAFQAKLDEFEKRGCKVVGCSVDSKFSHWAWLNTEKNDGGIKGVKNSSRDSIIDLTEQLQSLEQIVHAGNGDVLSVNSESGDVRAISVKGNYYEKH